MPEEAQKSNHIRCRTIVEILGKPKEHVEEALKGYVGGIRKDRDLVVLGEDYAEATAQGNMWAKFVELDLVVKGLPKLIGFCFEYMPSSIEIIKPDDFRLLNSEMAGFLNDLQGRLHNVDMLTKQLKFQNDFLRVNMNAMMHNIVMITLKGRSLAAEQLASVTGIDKGELDKFIEKMIKEGKIIKEDELLSLA